MTRHVRTSAHPSCVVMPGFMPGIQVFIAFMKEDVDGRVKPGHDQSER